ncbi:MAG: diacylglycerol kinase family protein [Coriobacteriales bacterium]|jgi:diacylglycerol kinase|nr:diacylglycerol kinase family protein [Coriobacteriales bacterium]
MKPKTTLTQAFACALRGIGQTIAHERNIKIELGIAAVALIAAAALHVELWGWLAIITAIGLVLAAELFNSALEALVDLASPEPNPLAKKAKDAAAGAVLTLSMLAVVIGCIVYISALVEILAQS